MKLTDILKKKISEKSNLIEKYNGALFVWHYNNCIKMDGKKKVRF